MPTGKNGPANAYSRAVNAEIRGLMARRGHTQTSLSEMVGMSQPQISKTLFRNDAPLNTNQLDELARALGDQPAEILRRAEAAIAQQDTYALAAKPRTARERDVNETDYL